MGAMRCCLPGLRQVPGQDGARDSGICPDCDSWLIIKQAVPHGEGVTANDWIAGCMQYHAHSVSRADVGSMNVDLSHVLWRPASRAMDEQVDDGIDRVFADQIVVKPQVVNPLLQQPEGFR